MTSPWPESGTCNNQALPDDKRRNVIERMFCKLKNWRPIATRYDRLARNYLSSLALAAIIIAWT
jgi:transposase